jgi:hypothetical protein
VSLEEALVVELPGLPVASQRLFDDLGVDLVKLLLQVGSLLPQLLVLLVLLVLGEFILLDGSVRDGVLSSDLGQKL